MICAKIFSSNNRLLSLSALRCADIDLGTLKSSKANIVVGTPGSSIFWLFSVVCMRNITVHFLSSVRPAATLSQDVPLPEG